mmetsp:Transcript_18974/g.71821  ORF Transcript_18974/g.71821 Transcript_18974/m.71821 type:complete len:290 (-) Transcript_18974:251-1120(-)
MLNSMVHDKAEEPSAGFVASLSGADELSGAARKASRRQLTGGGRRKEPPPSVTERRFVCQTCGMAFNKPARLRRHLQTHDANRAHYTCSVEGCDKKYTREDHLKRHMVTHVGWRQFRCPEPGCGKSFYYRYHLRRHSRVHEDKPDGRKLRAKDLNLSVASSRAASSEEDFLPKRDDAAEALHGQAAHFRALHAGALSSSSSPATAFVDVVDGPDSSLHQYDPADLDPARQKRQRLMLDEELRQLAHSDAAGGIDADYFAATSHDEEAVINTLEELQNADDGLSQQNAMV